MFSLVKRGLWIGEFEDLVSGAHLVIMRQGGDSEWIAAHWGWRMRHEPVLDRGSALSPQPRLALLKLDVRQLHRESWGLSQHPTHLLQRRLAKSVIKQVKRRGIRISR